ncbi:hypothetical protein ATJ93_4556 [Halopiger aswanensis]|uniref:Uncharacterized protein n=1 Tax=Halopiger aswanensis TaxID=148449 RepID=A0A419VWU0_9EURY|nr:hypothetical protein ATJ93_4556 [Halopiger aswanensis]
MLPIAPKTFEILTSRTSVQHLRNCQTTMISKLSSIIVLRTRLSFSPTLAEVETLLIRAAYDAYLMQLLNKSGTSDDALIKTDSVPNQTHR